MWMPLLAAVAVLVLGYAGVCLTYYLLQDRLIFVGRPLASDHRFRFKQPFEELRARAGDGAELHAVRFTVERAEGAVLYFHGNTGTLRRWGKQAPKFTRSGHEVLMPEPRGYGKSKGRRSEHALLADALLWYDLLRTTWPEDRITVYGRSLGSALAVHVAAHRAPRAMALESPFARLIDAARSRFRWLPYTLLLKYRFANDETVRGVRCPVVIFHGERDAIVPFTSALRLYSCIPKDVERELIAFPTGHHSDLPRFTRYHRALRALLGGSGPGHGPASA